MNSQQVQKLTDAISAITNILKSSVEKKLRGPTEAAREAINTSIIQSNI